MATAMELLTEGSIVIGSDRHITVPNNLKRIAVQYDHNIETVTFDCPRFWDGYDLSEMNIFINYMLKDGTKGQFIATDVCIDLSDDSIIHFNWTITGNVTQVAGAITMQVCAKQVDSNGMITNHWNSEICTDLRVSEGMECYETPDMEYPDVISQLIDRIEALEKNGAAVEVVTFTINNIEYTAKKGMTWGEFIESEYNADTECSECGESFKRFESNARTEYVYYIMEHCPTKWDTRVAYSESDGEGDDSIFPLLSDEIVANYNYFYNED